MEQKLSQGETEEPDQSTTQPAHKTYLPNITRADYRQRRVLRTDKLPRTAPPV